MAAVKMDFRLILGFAVTAVGLLVVLFVFAHFFGWLPGLIEIGIVVLIILISAYAHSFQDVVIALMAGNLLIAFFVFAHFFNWRPALVAIGAAVFILLTVGCAAFGGAEVRRPAPTTCQYANLCGKTRKRAGGAGSPPRVAHWRHGRSCHQRKPSEYWRYPTVRSTYC